MKLAEFVYHLASTLIQLYAEQYLNEDFARALTESQNELNVPSIKTYDFIVVGGGTAGCVVAGRLSEHFNVLLLEAGGVPPPAVHVPAYTIAMYQAPSINDLYVSLPDSETGIIQNNRLARMLGGCGSHNGMVHNRGSPYDYDNWSTMLQDDSWSYANVLQYFKKLENFTGVLYEEGAEDLYGYEGPMRIIPATPPILPLWFDAGRELGYPVGDPNGNQSETFHPLHVSMDGGRRVNTYLQYIRPYDDGVRPNLTVVKYADVQEILISEDRRAYGVQFVRHGTVQRAYASKEVILSAGTFRSPLLLFKSGVGPQDVLSEAGIPVRVPLEGVGRNLVEHVGVRVGPIYVNDSTLLPRIHEGDELKLERYILTGEGVLGETSGGPQAMMRSSRAKVDNPELIWPDLYMALDQAPNNLVPIEQDEGLEVIEILDRLGRPKSTGRLTLNGTAYKAGERDDSNLALIDFKLLSDPTDVDVLLDGIEYGLRIIEETQAFQSLGTTLSTEPWQECSEFEFRSEEYWRCYIKARAVSQLHPVGTCRMGLASDPLAVVDSTLRVIDMDGLRVIDASVMPTIPNANINAPIIMIAEKSAHEIVNEYL